MSTDKFLALVWDHSRLCLVTIPVKYLFIRSVDAFFVSKNCAKLGAGGLLLKAKFKRGRLKYDVMRVSRGANVLARDARDFYALSLIIILW